LLSVEGQVVPETSPDPLRESGRVFTGARVKLTLTTTPNVQQITSQMTIGNGNSSNIAWQAAPNPPTGTGVYTTEIDATSEGSYSVVSNTFTQRNVLTTRATANFNFVATNNVNPGSLPGPPRVIRVIILISAKR
jgi:hypothetical protein